MSFDVFTDEELQNFEEGLLLLGWKPDIRLTTEDVMQLKNVAENTVELKRNNELSLEKIEELATRAFNIMEFQIMNVDERAAMIEGSYQESNHLKLLVPLIDEAMFCYFRGYYTASLATLFIVVESYLLKLYGWSAGDKKPSFSQLKTAITNLEPSDAREKANSILKIIYSHYDASSPSTFNFNRHGLLHGMRNALEVDKMNCARIIQFFDLASSAEGIGRGYCMTDNLKRRAEAYEQCVYFGREKLVLGRVKIT